MAVGLLLKNVLRRPGATAQIAGRHMGRTAQNMGRTAQKAVQAVPGISPDMMGDARMAVQSYSPGQRP